MNFVYFKFRVCMNKSNSLKQKFSKAGPSNQFISCLPKFCLVVIPGVGFVCDFWRTGVFTFLFDIFWCGRM